MPLSTRHAIASRYTIAIHRAVATCHADHPTPCTASLAYVHTTPALPCTRSVGPPMPHSRPVPRPGATRSAATVPVAEHVRAHHRDPSPRGSVAVHAPRNTRVGHRRTGWRSVPEMLPSAPDVTSWSFFNPAQAHVGEPAQYVSAATNTLSQNAMASSCGMDLLAHPGRTSKAGWLQPMVSPSASTGRCHEDVPPPVTPTGTDAQDVEKSTTALRRALEHRGREPLTPYQSGAWEVEV